MRNFLERNLLLCFVLGFTLILTILILIEKNNMKVERDEYNSKCQAKGGVMFTYRQGRGYGVKYECRNPNSIVEVD